MEVQENGKRQSVFLTLVDEGEGLTPSEIGVEIDESRQTVKYHLDQLVAGGLVVRDDDAYRCQPIFVDDEFEDEFVDLIAHLVPAVSERIDVSDDVSPEDRATVVFNCIRMFIALELLGSPDEYRVE